MICLITFLSSLILFSKSITKSSNSSFSRPCFSMALNAGWFCANAKVRVRVRARHGDLAYAVSFVPCPPHAGTLPYLGVLSLDFPESSLPCLLMPKCGTRAKRQGSKAGKQFYNQWAPIAMCLRNSAKDFMREVNLCVLAIEPQVGYPRFYASARR